MKIFELGILVLPPFWEFLDQTVTDDGYKKVFGIGRVQVKLAVSLLSTVIGKFNCDIEVVLMICRTAKGDVVEVVADSDRELGPAAQHVLDCARDEARPENSFGMPLDHLTTLLKLLEKIGREHGDDTKAEALVFRSEGRLKALFHQPIDTLPNN